MRSIYFFADDFESPTSGNWANSVNPEVNHWNLGCGVSGIYRPSAADVSIASSASKPLSGNYALWADNLHSAAVGLLGDSLVTMANAITLPDHGNVHLQFEHKYDFESNFDSVNNLQSDYGDPDGGVIEYSVDGGDWTNTKELIRDGRGYQNFIQSGEDPPNPLAGSRAFVGNTLSTVTNKIEYVSTQLDLSSLAGRSVKFRFRMGTDKFAVGQAGLGGLGWMIDDVAIYTCGQVIATPTTGLEVSENGGSAAFTVQLATAVSSSKHVTLTLSSTKDTEGTVSPTELTFNDSNWNIPQTVTVTAVDDTVVDGLQKFSVKISRASSTDDPGYENMPDTSVSITNADNDGAATRKRKGGAWDLISMLIILGAIVERRLRMKTSGVTVKTIVLRLGSRAGYP